jgi:hypothetical protein
VSCGSDDDFKIKFCESTPRQPEIRIRVGAGGKKTRFCCASRQRQGLSRVRLADKLCGRALDNRAGHRWASNHIRTSANAFKRLELGACFKMPHEAELCDRASAKSTA